jgi:hypothetical protein
MKPKRQIHKNTPADCRLAYVLPSHAEIRLQKKRPNIQIPQCGVYQPVMRVNLSRKVGKIDADRAKNQTQFACDNPICEAKSVKRNPTITIAQAAKCEQRLSSRRSTADVLQASNAIAAAPNHVKRRSRNDAGKHRRKIRTI